MSATLDSLLQNATVWRGSEYARADSASIASGFESIDEILGGWPLGALIELIPCREGIGELSVLLPALAQLSRDERWIALINPPYIPYAPALFHAGIDLARIVVIRASGTTDMLWAMEQALRCGTCSAVLGWPPMITEQGIRRLQLATETGRAFGIYFTRPGALPRTSPVPWRLRIDGTIDDIRVEVLKRRGGNLTAPIRVNRPHSNRLLKNVASGLQSSAHRFDRNSAQEPEYTEGVHEDSQHRASPNQDRAVVFQQLANRSYIHQPHVR